MTKIMLKKELIPIIEELKNKLLSIVGDRYLTSLIVFGSCLRTNSSSFRFSSRSDLDYIVVLADDIPSQLTNKVFSYVRYFQEENSFARYKDINFFFRGLQQATGMFISGFVCTEKSIKSRIFHQVFNTSKFFTNVLSPRNSVWLSLYQNYYVVYGKDVLRDWSFIQLTIRDLIKSLIINLLLSIGGFFLFPFSRTAFRYQIEGVKWSIYTFKNFVLVIDSLKSNKQLGFNPSIISVGNFPRVIRWINLYRTRGVIYPLTLCLFPIYVFVIHEKIRRMLIKLKKLKN